MAATLVGLSGIDSRAQTEEEVAALLDEALRLPEWQTMLTASTGAGYKDNVFLANTDPEAAVAARATTVPLLKLPEQVVPQLMPAGELDTVPVPVPVFATARENVCIVAGVVAQASGL